jgi:hypothetical protein
MEPKKVDLADLDTAKGGEEGFELQLLHPTTGDPLTTKITVLGQDSDTYQDAAREQARKRSVAMRKRRNYQPSTEELDSDFIDLAVAATKGWVDMQVDGKDYPFTVANARLLYRRFKWIREQVESAIGDRNNFLPSAANS